MMRRNQQKGNTSAKTNGKSKKAVFDNQQKKITQFFKTTPSHDDATENGSQSEKSPYFQPEKVPFRKSVNSTKPVNNLIIPNLSREVIVIEVSDSDPETEKIEDEDIKSGSGKTLDEPNDSNEQLETINNNNNQNNCKSDGHMTPETDSGEELLSQIDIDGIISSQEGLQKNKTKISPCPTALISLTKPSIPTTPKKSTGLNQNETSPIYRTTTKSPKAKVNKFSPLRHLKRSRSQTSNRSNSSSQSPSPSRNSSPFTNNRNDQKNGTPVKKLQYFSAKPYYVKNFSLVVDSVVHDDHNTYLLNTNDWKTVDSFNHLSSEAQCLYVRLFQRKWEWKVASSIKYPLIAEDLLPFFIELHSAGFLIEIKEHTPDLECLLDLLNGEQIVMLSKQMKVDPSKKTKQLCKKALINSTRKQQTLCGSGSNIMVKSTLKLLGSTYQLEKERKDLFSRLFILYCPPQYWEDENDQTANHLLKMLMSDTGQMEYPEYTINKTTKIYSSRDCLLRFHEAWALHCDITAHMESKNWNNVVEIARQSLSQLKEILKNEDHQAHDSSLPAFLRVYTAGSVLTRVSWLGVDGFQKLKDYSGANEIIEFLLSQECYLPHYRGRWYERSVINMQHLKKPIVQVQRALEIALCDMLVQNSHKLFLSDRLEKLNEKEKRKIQLNKSKSSKAKKGKNELLEVMVMDDEEEGIVGQHCLFRLTFDTPDRKIEGEKMDKPNSTGKSVFIGERDSNGSSTASSVELFAVEFYKKLGYKYGLHAEGSVVTTIYGLIFWDEIYNDKINDAFHAPYQAFPLDIHFEDFYTRREDSITEKLIKLRNTWSMEDALEVMENNWEIYFNKLSIVNWSVFSSIDQAKTLVRVMGLQVTAAICERLARNFRHYRSGFPDLVVWNEEKFMFVEVKGPNDVLSHKQMLWIDFLLSIGAKAEVCHVVAVSNKRIRM